MATDEMEQKVGLTSDVSILRILAHAMGAGYCAKVTTIATIITTTNRVDRLRLCGNGVVPAQAAKAFRELNNEIVEPTNDKIKRTCMDVRAQDAGTIGRKCEQKRMGGLNHNAVH